MKKFLFLTLLLVAISYPAITLLAQDAAKEIIEDILVIEQETKDSSVVEEETVVTVTETIPTSDENTGEMDDIKTIDVSVEQTIEDEVVVPVRPRNPDTEVVMPKNVAPTTQEVNNDNNTPLDNPVSEVISGDENTVVTDTTHPQLNLTEDKSEMIRLSEKAASVIVGNPNHISVLLDTPDTIIVVPRLAGASYFTVIGENGKVIMQRHVVVGAPKDDYVRIRRSCNAGDSNCQQTSVYYCPNTCHQVLENAANNTRRR